MREILCRGKRLYVDEWVYGTLIICQGKYYIATDTTKITASYTAISGDGTSDGLHYNICGLCEVNPETVGQYTGLKDKNGKKIFEGDILRCVDELNAIVFYARVEFGNPNARYDWGWQLVKIKGDEPNLDILLWVEAGIDDYVHCQVIGNIHDNPEYWTR